MLAKHVSAHAAKVEVEDVIVSIPNIINTLHTESSSYKYGLC